MVWTRATRLQNLQISVQSIICGIWWANISIPGGPTFQTTKLPATILVWDTTTHLWGLIEFMP